MISGFSYNREDAEIFKTEFASFLPDVIIDGHNHCWLKEHLTISKQDYGVYKAYKPFTDFDYMEQFSIDEFYYCVQTVFPAKTVRGIFFGLPFPMLNIGSMNRYVMDNAADRGNGFYYIPGQFEDAGNAEALFAFSGRRGFLGFKPYPDLAKGNPSDAESKISGDGDEPGLYDMLNRSFLEYAEKHSLVIMLHVPGKKRLRNETLRRDLRECIGRYKNTRFIFAHVGRSFCYADVEDSIDFLTGFDNVFFDTALVNDPLVMEYLLRRVSSERVIFGSDSPLAFARGKDICINNHHIYTAATPVPWGLCPPHRDLIPFTFYIYEELRAILYAAKAVYGKSRDTHLENIFYKNSAAMLKQAGTTLPAAEQRGESFR
jgi:hypothetical protein